MCEREHIVCVRKRDVYIERERKRERQPHPRVTAIDILNRVDCSYCVFPPVEYTEDCIRATKS